MNDVRRIALLMGQELSFTRAVIRGIREYGLQRPGWIFRCGPTVVDILPGLREWRPDGIIAGLYNKEFAQRVLRFRKPIIDTGCCISNLRAPVVDVDHDAVGRMAAEHFLEKRFASFGYFGVRAARYSQLRETSFRNRLQEAGFEVSSFYGDYLYQTSEAARWKVIDRKTRTWLKKLRKPAAIFACNDIPARLVADTCSALGLCVPNDVAILGVDNDDLECSLTVPSLSSIAIPGERIGYEAARLLERMMSGQGEQRSVFLPPVRTVTRQSTDTMAISDPMVTAALVYMRQDAARGINVESVALAVGVGRRELERKFRRILGSTLLRELRRIRVERAKELLAGTNLRMPAVAKQSGFSTPQRLAVVFRQFERISPSTYRRQARN